ncbi:MAG: hypothetical protein HFG83_04500 [Dorea sp.]|jgi:hypothetical protein|nr:hypothetical protein [Dorea sp.]MCI9453076.1 hypothetical protein [Dorea sp.]
MAVFFYAQTRAEEICRWDGARAARRVGKMALPYSIAQTRAEEICR